MLSTTRGLQILLICLAVAGWPVSPASAAEAVRPNIVVILVDDMGYSDLGCYGSEIPTPNIDRLATNGLRFTQFFNTARCCPTRAALLTGLYSHQAGVGHMTDDQGEEYPGFRGQLNKECVTLGEAMRGAGYFTAMSGKWHVGQNYGVVPWNRGFDRSLNSPAGGFYFPGTVADLYLNGAALGDNVPGWGTNWYTSDLWADYGLRFIDESLTNNKPFFLYLPFNAPHFPLQASTNDIARFRGGQYTNGWDVLRTNRYQRQLQMGLIDSSWPLSPRDPAVSAWDSLSVSNQDRFDNIMAIYAAVVSRLDTAVGSLVDGLKQRGVYTNTLILLMSDNGGNAEGNASGVLKGNPGGPTTSSGDDIKCGQSWATLENTPFREYKHYTHEGGIATPLIVHWPAQITQPGLRKTTAHVVDIMPTCLEAGLGTYPASFNGNPIRPMEGRSLGPIIRGETTGPRYIYWEHEGNRAARYGDWKLVATGDTSPWELYNLAADRTELTNLITIEINMARQLTLAWESWATRAHVYPSPAGASFPDTRSWPTVNDTSGGDGDGFPEPGETVDLTEQIIKQGSGANTGLIATIASDDPYVTLLSNTAPYSSFSSGVASNLAPFRLRFSTNTPNYYVMMFDITVRDSGGVVQWSDVFGLEVQPRTIVNGVVTDCGSGHPLTGATVAAGSLASASTDAFGRYRLPLEPGGWVFTASATGYSSVQDSNAVSGAAQVENYQLPWAQAGLSLQLFRPSSGAVTIPTNISLLLQPVVHDGPCSPTSQSALAWSTVAGPVAAQFGNPSAGETPVCFPQAGSYILQLTANNGSNVRTQRVTVTVSDAASGGEPSPTGRVAYLRFDDPPGSVIAADSSGSGNFGMVSNLDLVAAWTNGVVNTALQFDGSNDLVTISNTPLINTATISNRTVSLWFRVDNASGTAKQVLYEQGGTGRGLNFYIVSGRLYVGGWNTNAGSESGWQGTWVSTDQIVAGRWHHVAMTLHGGTTITSSAVAGYLDGTLFGQGSGSQIWSHTGGIGIGAAVGATRFHDGTTVGSNKDGAYFKGRIDELRLYNRVLTGNEIVLLASGAVVYSPVVAVDAGPDQPLHQGLTVPLSPTVTASGEVLAQSLFSWQTEQGPAQASALFSQPNGLGVPTQATLDRPGPYVFRLRADTGELASFDDVSLSAIHSFSEWINGFAGLSDPQQQPAADPDGDGFPNNFEFELGSRPDRADSQGGSDLHLARTNGTNYQVAFQLRRGAGSRGFAYEVQRESGAASNSWATCPCDPPVLEDAGDYDFQTVRLRLQLDAAGRAAAQNYFRLRYSLNPP